MKFYFASDISHCYEGIRSGDVVEYGNALFLSKRDRPCSSPATYSHDWILLTDNGRNNTFMDELQILRNIVADMSRNERELKAELFRVRDDFYKLREELLKERGKPCNMMTEERRITL